MKVSAKLETPGFIPRELTITVENKAELNAIYALMNSTWIDTAVRKAFGVDLLATPAEFDEPHSSSACDALHEALRNSAR